MRHVTRMTDWAVGGQKGFDQAVWELMLGTVSVAQQVSRCAAAHEAALQADGSPSPFYVALLTVQDRDRLALSGDGRTTAEVATALCERFRHRVWSNDVLDSLARTVAT